MNGIPNRAKGAGTKGTPARPLTGQAAILPPAATPGQGEGDGRTPVDRPEMIANGTGLDLDRLADGLRRRLTHEQRRRLAALLTGETEKPAQLKENPK